MLCSSRMNPKLSADTVLNGIHDFNKKPMAPLDTKVLVHKTPKQCHTWAVHGQEGHCIGGAPNHHQCYQVYISSTNGIHIAQTVECFPTHCKMPTMTATNKATLAATQLIDILQTPQPNSPFPTIGDKQMQALAKLAKPFHDAMPKEPPAIMLQAPRVENPPFPQPAQPGLAPPPSTMPATLIQHCYPQRSWTWTHRALHAFLHQANPVYNPKTGKEMEYCHLIQHPNCKHMWAKSFANKLGCVAQGVGNRIEGTNTITFIPHTDVPPDRVCTHG